MEETPTRGTQWPASQTMLLSRSSAASLPTPYVAAVDGS
jgi:hypothetical protein